MTVIGLRLMATVLNVFHIKIVRYMATKTIIVQYVGAIYFCTMILYGIGCPIKHCVATYGTIIMHGIVG